MTLKNLGKLSAYSIQPRSEILTWTTALIIVFRVNNERPQAPRNNDLMVMEFSVALCSMVVTVRPAAASYHAAREKGQGYLKRIGLRRTFYDRRRYLCFTGSRKKLA